MATIPFVDTFDCQGPFPLDFRSVKLNATQRDAIPNNARYDGMEVWVVNDQKKYRLEGGTANENWVEVTTGGGGSGTLQDVTFSSTAPTTQGNDGDIWFRPNDDTIELYYKVSGIWGMVGSWANTSIEFGSLTTEMFKIDLAGSSGIKKSWIMNTNTLELYYDNASSSITLRCRAGIGHVGSSGSMYGSVLYWENEDGEYRRVERQSVLDDSYSIFWTLDPDYADPSYNNECSIIMYVEDDEHYEEGMFEIRLSRVFTSAGNIILVKSVSKIIPPQPTT